MSYIEEGLLEGEQVIYRTTLHWIIFLWPAFLFLLAGFIALGSDGAAAFFFALAGVVGTYAFIKYASSEFCVTNKRVLVKAGLIERRSLELLLTKVEGVAVDQGLLGQMFDYGTIVVLGTGGTRKPFKEIAAPFYFRKKVREQVTAAHAAAS
jgi:uncharacterized membrane protein YdbT with pleckstrin-like domain